MLLPRGLIHLLLATAFVFTAGLVGFYGLSRVAGGQPDLLECAYTTVITLATVGSRELHPLSDVWYGKLFIILLVLSGMGVLLALATSVTAFLVEGEILNVFRRRRMERILSKMNDHFIVCGVGSTGSVIVEELLGSGHGVVVVDTGQEAIERLLQRHETSKVAYVLGSATDDDTLEAAGLTRAVGIVVALPDERDDLFVTVTARQVSATLKIVARASDPKSEARLLRAGATAVVNPSRIGGLRMVSEMIRPQVVEFLDQMLRAADRPLRIEELSLEEGCGMAGQLLRETNLRSEADLLVLAIREPNSDTYQYNPPPDKRLKPGSTLIVLGPVESVHRIREQMI